MLLNGLVALGWLAAQPSNITNTEKAAVAARQKIVSAHLEMDQTLYRGESSDPSVVRTTTIWFDGRRCRNDVMHKVTMGGPFREICCNNAPFVGYHLYFTTRSQPGEPPTGVLITKLTPARKLIELNVIDPRTIGMALVSSGNLVTSTIDSVVGRADRRATTEVAEIFGGRPCRLVEYIGRPVPYRMRLWIVPECDYAVAKLELTSDDGKVVETVENSLTFIPSARLWFLEASEYRQVFDGRLVQRETVKVNVKSLNEPVPDGSFTLEGMDIPPGTYVIGAPDTVPGKVYKWNGQEIVEDRDYGVRREVKIRGQRQSSVWLYAGVAGFGILAVRLLDWSWKSK